VGWELTGAAGLSKEIGLKAPTRLHDEGFKNSMSEALY
jgi:hypothetical protein